jgi:hypothetical protein
LGSIKEAKVCIGLKCHRRRRRRKKKKKKKKEEEEGRRRRKFAVLYIFYFKYVPKFFSSIQTKRAGASVKGFTNPNSAVHGMYRIDGCIEVRASETTK